MANRRIVQIAANAHNLYALSDDGVIFALRGDTWYQMPSPFSFGALAQPNPVAANASVDHQIMSRP